jgi:hypothetical protein
MFEKRLIWCFVQPLTQTHKTSAQVWKTIRIISGSKSFFDEVNWEANRHAPSRICE